MRRAVLGVARWRLLGGASLLPLLYVVFAVSVASAAVFSAAIIDGADTFSSGDLILNGTTGAGTCISASGSVSVNSTTCTGSSLPTTALSTTPSTGSITLSAGGSLGGSAGTVSSNGCGAQYANTSVGTDTAIAYGGLTYQVAGPLGGSAVSFDGASGAFNTLNSYAGPNVFTEAAWFNTTSSGSIMGFSNSYATTGQSNWDRMMWVDPAGDVVAGVYSGATQEITSTTAYNDGAWHLAVMTLSASGPTKGLRLYVDGSLVASNKSVTSAQAYTGYWHIGWSGAATGWADPPTSAYFNGALAGVTIIPSALTAAQVSSLYSSATFATYSSGVTSYTPTAYWPLNDSGTSTYTGAIPGVGSNAPTLADASGNGNTGTVEGTVALGAAGPTSLGGNSVLLPGSAGSLINTTTQYADPNNGNGTLSQSIWFNTTTSGSIMGFTSQQTDTPTPTTYDRMFWIDSTGHLVYSIYSPDVTGSYSEVTSPGTYNNGAWHLAVATVGPAGEILYVDGVEVASSAVAQNAQVFTGYWHIGYAYTNGWANPPTSDYFNGMLAHAAIYPSQLSSAQVMNIYSATSVSSEESAILSLSPTSYWPLTDSVSSPACNFIQITVQDTHGSSTTCAIPSGPGACPSPSAAVVVGTMGAGSMVPPTPAAPSTVITTMDVSSSTPVNAVGLRLLIPITYSESLSSFNAQLFYPSGVVIL